MTVKCVVYSQLSGFMSSALVAASARGRSDVVDPTTSSYQ
jgi:hypothetical protein